MHTKTEGVAVATCAPVATAAGLHVWRQWCRLCAKEDTQGNISVFFKDEQHAGGIGSAAGGGLATAMAMGTGNSDMSLAAAIGKYFWVNITRDEELPRMLCTECFSLVTALVNFSERVTKVQQMFCTLQATPAENAAKLDLHALRIKYGLLDEEREHVLMQQTQPEVHYFESKPKINELEEQLFESDARMVAPNPLEPQQTPRIRIKIKKEQIVEDSSERSRQGYDEELDDEDDDDDDPFNGDYEDADDDMDVDFKPLQEIDDKATSSEEEEADENEDKKFIEQLQADDLLIGQPTKTSKSKRKLEVEQDAQVSPPKIRRLRRNNAALGAAEPDYAADEEEDVDADVKAEAEADHLGDFQCNVCSRRFKRAQHFRQHMKRTHAVHTSAPALPCTQCERTFTTTKQLERHAKGHLPMAVKKVQPCPYCDKKFTSSTLVQSHIKYIHMHERPFICEECGVRTATNAALKTHMLTHTDYAPFECEVCKKGFKNQIRLRNHMETHDPNKHICAECGLQLNSRATLNRHLLVHSDEMTHKCDYCGRAFKRAKALKNHLILHTGLKPYSCDFCDRTFANGSNCRSHKKKSHPEELAALEATGGGKMYTRNIPKLEALKAVTKAADNLAPVVSKQSGNFAFGKKPKTTPTKDQKPPSKAQNQIAIAATDAAVQLDLKPLHSTMSGAVLVSSPPVHDMNAITSAAASIPTIDNIYNHIMKQASMSAAVAATTQKRSPSQASSSSCAIVDHESEAAVHLQQLHHIHLQHQQQQQQSNLSQPSTPGTPGPQQHFYAHLPPDHDSQASSSHMTSAGGGDEHSNASAHFYNHIRQNLPGPYM